MYQQRQRELEKQYNQQVRDIKAKKMAGQSAKKAVSFAICGKGRGGGTVEEQWCLFGWLSVLGGECMMRYTLCPVQQTVLARSVPLMGSHFDEPARANVH